MTDVTSHTLAKLVEERQWPQLRRRIRRVTQPREIGFLLYLLLTKDGEDDLILTLLSKLDGIRTYQYAPVDPHAPMLTRSSFASVFLKYVCNFDMGIIKTDLPGFVLLNHHVLKVLLDKYVALVGVPVEPYQFIRDLAKASTSLDSSRISMEHILSLREKAQLFWRLTLPKAVWGKPLTTLSYLCRMVEMNFPKGVLRFELDVHPEQARMTDDQGNLPIHWAIFYDSDKSKRAFYYAQDKLSDTKSVIQTLLDCFPEGAKCADNRGAYPLHLLLENLCKYCSNYDIYLQQHYQDVAVLMTLAPEILVRPNPTNQLLPFMAAACRANHTVIPAALMDHKVNLTYLLLRKDPSIISLGRKSTSSGISLREKLQDTEAKLQQALGTNTILHEEIALLKISHGCPSNGKRKWGEMSSDANLGSKSTFVSPELSNKRTREASDMDMKN